MPARETSGAGEIRRITQSEKRALDREFLPTPLGEIPQTEDTPPRDEGQDQAEAVLYLLQDMGRPDGSKIVDVGVLDRAREIIGAAALVEFNRSTSEGGAIVYSLSGVVPAGIDLTALVTEGESSNEERIFVSGRGLVACGRGHFLAAVFEKARDYEEWEKGLLSYLAARLTLREPAFEQET